MVESCDKTLQWSTGEGNGKPLQYSCLENSMNSMKRQKDRTLKNELPRSVGAQYATGDWRNNLRKNEEMEPKWKQCPVVDVTGDGSQVQCCKEEYCIGTWNVRSTDQGKLCGSQKICGSLKNWKILQQRGIPGQLTCFLRNLFVGEEATVRTGRGKQTGSKLGKE